MGWDFQHVTVTQNKTDQQNLFRVPTAQTKSEEHRAVLNNSGCYYYAACTIDSLSLSLTVFRLCNEWRQCYISMSLSLFWSHGRVGDRPTMTQKRERNSEIEKNWIDGSRDLQSFDALCYAVHYTIKIIHHLYSYLPKYQINSKLCFFIYIHIFNLVYNNKKLLHYNSNILILNICQNINLNKIFI